MDKFFKAERKTKMLFGLFGLLMSVLFVAFSLGFKETPNYVMPAIGFFLGAIILSENGVQMYFKKSTYKTVDLADLIGIVSLMIGGGVIASSVLMIPVFASSVPVSIVSFFSSFSVVIGVGAGIFALIHMFT